SRTVRLVTNVEPFTTGTEGIFMVRSNFLINEFRAGESRSLAGWCGHRLRRTGDGFVMLVKEVYLMVCDLNLRNSCKII
ncbi:MAG: phenoxybenzoate dioxygenase, partial [Alphaproteobacteria bacterium]|nr:phenoxybenzoate dioxygenase [Alphaproteobacteria bacterium]